MTSSSAHDAIIIPPERRETHRRWLMDLTDIPTAAGREHRVIAWVRRWVGERPELGLETDPAGNLTIGFAEELASKAHASEPSPTYLTAHLDHPAFVVERAIGPSTLELTFRGGVMDDYFERARITLHNDDGTASPGAIVERDGPQDPFKRFIAELDEPAASAAPGDIATWALPGPEIVDGRLHAGACDDLAAVVAALAALDERRLARAESGETDTRDPAPDDLRVLLTRAEEIGFIGAIGACRHATMPASSRVIALENSRAMPEAPIGAGPIVRVGDRISVFSPGLTSSIHKRAEEIAGGPTPSASQKLSEAPTWRWQRKLMAGGACEASVFCAFGYEATCLCLPLGNYHNMGDLDAVQAGTNTDPPTPAREVIALDDFYGLVDLLVACAQRLPPATALRDRLDALWEQRRAVLDGESPAASRG